MPYTVTNPFFREAILRISRIIIGCTKLVDSYGPENQWRTKILKSLKPSNELLVAVLVVELSKQDEKMHVSPKEIKKRLSESGVEVHHSTISRALKQLVRVNHLEINTNTYRMGPGRPKTEIMGIAKPGPKSVYSRSNEEIFVSEFVRTIFFRGMIYLSLYDSGTLHRFLKFFHYKRMITLKYSEVGEILKVEKAMTTNTIEFFNNMESIFLQIQKDLKKKTDDRIMLDAFRLMRRELKARDWQNDQLYSTFFKCGGLCYSG